MERRKSDGRPETLVIAGKRLLVTAIVALVLLGLSYANLFPIGLDGAVLERVYGAGPHAVATMSTPVLVLPLPGVQATPTSTTLPQPPSPPEMTATPTELPPPTPTPTDPPPTETATPTNTPASAASPPPGRHGVSAYVFIDYQCDGVFQSGVDVPLGGVTVRLNLSHGGLTRQTSSNGTVNFAGVDLSDGGTVSIEGLGDLRFQGCYVHACTRTSVNLPADDFQPGQIEQKHVDFRLHPAYDPWSVGGATPAPPLAGPACGGGSSGQAAEPSGVKASAVEIEPATTPEPELALSASPGVPMSPPSEPPAGADTGVTEFSSRSLFDEVGAEAAVNTTTYRDESGQRHVVDEIAGDGVLVELVGSPDNLASVSVSARIAGDASDEANDAAGYMEALLRSVAPGWAEGAKWLTANLNIAGTRGGVETTYGDRRIVLQRIGGFDVVILTVERTQPAPPKRGIHGLPAAR